MNRQRQERAKCCWPCLFSNLLGCLTEVRTVSKFLKTSQEQEIKTSGVTSKEKEEKREKSLAV